uniref:DUF4781 domain-containing protein n=1 Tax=Ditylenchus dipsaci TaxID=166011 RepID=A0A915EKH4_9BILA
MSVKPSKWGENNTEELEQFKLECRHPQELFSLLQGKSLEYSAESYNQFQVMLALSLFGQPDTTDNTTIDDNIIDSLLSRFSQTHQDIIGHVVQSIEDRLIASKSISLTQRIAIAKSVLSSRTRPEMLATIIGNLNSADMSEKEPALSNTDKIEASRLLINLKTQNEETFSQIIVRIEVVSDSKKLLIGFVDRAGRIYSCWTDFLDNNELPKAYMVYPCDGVYNSGEGASIALMGDWTAACRFKENALIAGDFASTIGCIAAIGATATSLLVPVAGPIMLGINAVGVASAAYSTARSTSTLVDRKRHAQPIGLNDTKSRNLWLCTAAGAFGLTSFGLTARLGSKMRTATLAGQEVSRSCTLIYNVAACSGLFTSGASIANLLYTLLQEKRMPSWQESSQLAVSLFFFFNIVVTVKTADAFIREAQAEIGAVVPENYENSATLSTFESVFGKMFACAKETNPRLTQDIHTAGHTAVKVLNVANSVQLREVLAGNFGPSTLQAAASVMNLLPASPHVTSLILLSQAIEF